MAGEMAVLIGRNIRAARIEKNWNQRELATELADPAASNMHVSEWERGVRKPSDRYMPLLSDALGKPVEWFFRDHDAAATPDLAAALNGNGDKPQLDRIEAAVSEIAEQIQLLRAEQTADVAEVLKRIDEALPPTGQSQDPPPP